MDIDKEIDKILGYKTYSDRRKVDSLLEMDANLYCNLGTDSTKTEKKEVERCSRKLYKAIATINRLEGFQYLQYLKDHSNG